MGKASAAMMPGCVGGSVLLLTRMCFIEVLGLNSRRSRAVLMGPAAAVLSAAGCAASVAAAEVLLQRCLACAVPAKGCSCCTRRPSTRLTGSCMLQARHARMLCRQVCITAKMVLLWLRLLLKLQRAHGGFLTPVEVCYVHNQSNYSGARAIGACSDWCSV